MIKRRIGRRGAFLLFLAILDSAYGYSLIIVPTLVNSYDLLLPLKTWIILWLVMGVVCLSGVFAKTDWFQYGCSALFKAAWAALYLQLWIVQHDTHAWVSTVIWLAFAMIILLVGGWPETARLPRVEEP